MADILQGNKREGYWSSGSGGGEMPELSIPADYPRWWEQVHTLIIEGESIRVQRTDTGFPDGKPLVDRLLTEEEAKVFWCAFRNTFVAEVKDGIYEIRRHDRKCQCASGRKCSSYLDQKIHRSKYENTVIFEGEKIHLPVTFEHNGDGFEQGTVTMAGQTFPVWRWKENYYWQLGKSPDPSAKARYWVSLSRSLVENGDGGKREKAALAFLLEKGLDLKKVLVEPIWLYRGYVSLTHSDYEQVRHLNQCLNLFER